MQRPIESTPDGPFLSTATNCPACRAPVLIVSNWRRGPSATNYYDPVIPPQEGAPTCVVCGSAVKEVKEEA